MAQTATGVAAKAGLAKIALVVAGTVAAAAGGVVVYEAARPETATERAAGVEVTLASLDRTYPDQALNVQGAQYAQVTGIADASVQTSVNKALRVPLDRAIGFYSRPGAACGGRMNVLGTQVVVGLRGPDLVSVRYVPRFRRSCGAALEDYPGFVVTVDLRTGRALTANDVFAPSAFTEAGQRRLWDGIPDSEDKRQLARGHTGSGGFFLPFQRDSWFRTPRRPGYPPWTLPFFRERRLDIVHTGQDLSPNSERYGLRRTGAYSFPVPYAKVRDLFKPELAALLPTS